MGKVIDFKTGPVVDLQKQTNTCIVIPARLGSTRYPHKMLAQANAMDTLIEYVFRQCQIAHNSSDVFVATDSQEIADLFPGRALITPESCENGTARIAWLVNQLNYKNVINVQGDMIEFPHHVIGDIIKLLEEGNDVVTVCKEMNQEDQMNPNTVKCINNGDQAHWFCRAAVAYGDWHLGIYGYSRKALATYPYLRKYAEEDIESLEQLRWLQNNQDITITYTYEDAAEINTKEDMINWQLTQQS